MWIFYESILKILSSKRIARFRALRTMYDQLIELIDHVLNENVYAIWSSPKLLYLSSHWNNLLDDDRRVKRSTTDWSNCVEEIRLLFFFIEYYKSNSHQSWVLVREHLIIQKTLVTSWATDFKWRESFTNMQDLEISEGSSSSIMTVKRKTCIVLRRSIDWHDERDFRRK